MAQPTMHCCWAISVSPRREQSRACASCLMSAVSLFQTVAREEPRSMSPCAWSSRDLRKENVGKQNTACFFFFKLKGEKQQTPTNHWTFNTCNTIFPVPFQWRLPSYLDGALAGSVSNGVAGMRCRKGFTPWAQTPFKRRSSINNTSFFIKKRKENIHKYGPGRNAQTKKSSQETILTQKPNQIIIRRIKKER